MQQEMVQIPRKEYEKLFEKFEIFKNAGFEVVKSTNLHHDSGFDLHNQLLSNTVRQAQTIINKSLEDIPILVFGIGRKTDGLTDLERKLLRDPWFWYN